MSASALQFAAGITLGGLPIDARFDIERGQVTALFGASGAGKSTLLALIAGALAPTRGTITLGGVCVADASTRHRLPLEQRGVGWVFQDGKLFPHLTVRDNLLFGARRQAPSASTARLSLDSVIAVLGLGALLARHPRDLSGGERQRTAIGRALLSQPQLLLLDEPLASLDAPRRAEILALLARVRTEFELPMLYVTHSLGEVLRLADRLLLLERGQMLAEGPLTELVGRADTPLLAQRQDAGTLIEAPTLPPQMSRSAVHLDLGEGLQLAVPWHEAAPGALLRVYVRASDVMLAAQAPHAISVRNVLPAIVHRISERTTDTALVELRVGAHQLLAALTHEAVSEMTLAPGTHTYALIKSVAIDIPAGARLLDASALVD